MQGTVLHDTYMQNMLYMLILYHQMVNLNAKTIFFYVF